MSDSTLTTPPDFDRDMRVTPIGPSRYEATIHRHWWILVGPNGGLILGQVAAALNAELASIAAQSDEPVNRQLRSLTVHFLRPPAEGTVEIDVDTVRVGRSLATLRATVTQDGKIVATGIAAASPAWATEIAFQDLAMPDVPSPDQLTDEGTLDREGPPLRTNYAYRNAFGYDDAARKPTSWMRTAAPRVIDTVALAAMVDGMVPPIFMRTGVAMAVPTIELTVHFRATLPHPGLGAEDFVLVEASSATLADGFLEEDVNIWGPDGTLLAQARQLALAR